MAQAGEAVASGTAAAVVFFRQGGWMLGWMLGQSSPLVPRSDGGPVRLLSDGKRKRQEASQLGLFKGGCSSGVVPCPLAESQQLHMVHLLVS